MSLTLQVRYDIDLAGLLKQAWDAGRNYKAVVPEDASSLFKQQRADEAARDWIETTLHRIQLKPYQETQKLSG